MDAQSIIDRVKGILFNPSTEWEVIQSEERSNKDLILFYVLPFAAIAAIISLLVLWTNTRMGTSFAVRMAIYQLVSPLVSVVIAAVVINELAETFDSVKDLNSAFKLVAYSYTPVLLMQIITSISWALGFLSILGLYGIYLLWIGLPVMMQTPEDKRLVYIIASVVVMLLVGIIVSALFGTGQMRYY
jgi:hypothetical protein